MKLSGDIGMNYLLWRTPLIVMSESHEHITSCYLLYANGKSKELWEMGLN